MPNKLFLFICAIWCLGYANAQNISVDAQSFTSQQLIEDVLVGMGCVENVQVTNTVSGQFSQDLSYGYFQNNGGSFPFEEGVVLSTGRLNNVPGPNTTLSDDDANGWNGDQDLEDALNINNTINATVIEFDFTPLSSSLSFRYIFASEEYRANNSSTCNFSDAFGFLIRPVGGQYENIALIPGTNTPVLVTTVRPEIIENGEQACPAINEQFFGSFNGNNSPINFNGQTAVLTAETDVVPNTQYHIKLVIADEGNFRFDSAVFLEANSFGLNVNLGPDLLISNNMALCTDEETTLTAIEAPPGETYTYRWFQDNILQPEVSNEFMVSQPGTYRVEVSIGNGCSQEDEIIVEYDTPPNVENATLTECDVNANGIAVYSLFSSEPQVINGDNSLQITMFFPTLETAEMNSGQITNPSQYENSTPNEIVYARVRNQSGCVSIAEVLLTTTPATTVPPQDYELCGENGFSEFQISEIDALFDAETMPNSTYSYFRTTDDAASGTNEITTTTFINETANQQTLIVVIENASECYENSQVTLISRHTPILIDDEILPLCADGQTPSVMLDAGVVQANANATYQWSNGATTPTISVTDAGDYTVTVTNTYASGLSCAATRTISVVEGSTAQISISLSGGFPNQTVTVNAQGQGNYTYALDNSSGPYQESNVFENVEPGQHTVFVRSEFCGTTPFTFGVLNFPKFFSPNGDGFNDVWSVLNADRNNPVVKHIYIFDRYGKLLTTLNSAASAWDGTFNGKALPASDYWFLAEFIDGFQYRSHFSLIR